MIMILTKQKTIANDIVSYLKSIPYYSRFFITVNQQTEVTEDHLPAILGYTKTSEPESPKDQDSANNHHRSFNLLLRIFVLSSEDIESITDTVYTDIYNNFSNGKYFGVLQVGNPNMNYLYEDTGTINTLDLEIPIYYKTTQA